MAREVRSRAGPRRRTTEDRIEPRFVFFGGKGGVGKTTCASAAAVRAATAGSRVLVVSTDPAHSLSDALGEKLSTKAKRIPLARAVRGGELFAAELNSDKALSRWLGEREAAIRVIADRGTYLDEEDIDRFLSLSFPGVDELVGLVELVRLSRSKSVDTVVVDTAPTGHTLRLLEMPKTLQRVAEVLDGMHAKHRFMASSLRGVWRPDFADEAIEAIDREASSLRQLLTDPSRTTFTWVTLAEELSVREAESGVTALVELGVRVEVVVVNRVWPTPDRDCALCESRVASERGWRERVRKQFVDQTVLEVPASRMEPRGLDALLDVANGVRCADVVEPYFHRASKSLSRASKPSAASSKPSALKEPLPSSFADTVRLVLFAGKGGVGKTTVAAASALSIAEERPRARVLLLSTDPAHSLGDVLNAPVSDAPCTIQDAPPNLDVRELDAAKTWRAEREHYRLGIDELFSSLFRGRMDASFDRAVLEDLLDLAPPGIDELVALAAWLDALVDDELSPRRPKRAALIDDSARHRGGPRGDGRARYDVVVVDTAPTGHTLRLLTLPSAALEWVRALMSVILKYRSVIGLGEFASDLTLLARRLRSLIALLEDPARCALVLVARPSTLPRLETERFARSLRRQKMPIATVVVNAVTAPTCTRCIEVASNERVELDRLARLADRFASSRRWIVAPAVYPPPRGVEPLQRWRESWRQCAPGAT